MAGAADGEGQGVGGASPTFLQMVFFTCKGPAF